MRRRLQPSFWRSAALPLLTIACAGSVDHKKMAEDAKIEIRNIRREGNETSKNMEKKSEISEDNMKDLQIDIQELTDKIINKIADTAKSKETEIMEV